MIAKTQCPPLHFLLICLSFVLGSNITYAQNKQTNPIEQMHQAIQEAKDDTSAFHLYHELVYLHFGRNLDSVVYYCDYIIDKVNPLIEESSKEDYKHRLLYHKMEALANKAYCFSIQNNYKAVIENDLIALPISEMIKDSVRIADICSNMGMAYFITGKTKKAIELQNRALKVSKNTKDTIGISNALNNLGSIFSSQKDFKQSTFYLEQAFALIENKGNPTGSVSILNNIANAYKSDRKNEKALENYSKALAICEDDPNCRAKATLHNNIAMIYFSDGDYTSSATHYQKAIKISKETNQNKSLTPGYLGMAKVYFETKKYKLAKKNALIVLKEAEKNNNYGWILTASSLLYKTNKKLGFIKEALKMHELYTAAADSINDNETIKALSDQKAKYFYELQAVQDSLKQLEKDHLLNIQVANANSEKKQATQRSILLFIGLIIVLLFSGFIYNRFRISKQQNALIQKQRNTLEKNNNEKEILLKEIHHRVKNNLQLVSSLLDLQTKNIADESTLSAIEDGQTRVKAMALIHQKLYQNEDITHIDFKDYVKQLINQIASIHPNGNEIKREINGPDLKLDIDTAIPLGLILNELVSNAYKYAFTNNTKGILKIDFASGKTGEYYLTVSDNGQGMPAHFDISKAKSLGLRLVRRLSKQLYGTSAYKNENGAIFTISFKSTETRKAID